MPPPHSASVSLSAYQQGLSILPGEGGEGREGFEGLVPRRHQALQPQKEGAERGLHLPNIQGSEALPRREWPHLVSESLIRAGLLWEQGFLRDFSFHRQQQQHRKPESQTRRSPGRQMQGLKEARLLPATPHTPAWPFALAFPVSSLGAIL